MSGTAVQHRSMRSRSEKHVLNERQQTRRWRIWPTAMKLKQC